MAGSVFCTNCGLNLNEPAAPPTPPESTGSPDGPDGRLRRPWLWVTLLVIGLALLFGGLYLIFRVLTSAQEEIGRRTPFPTLDRTALATFFPIPTETAQPATATLTRAPTLTRGPTLTPTILSAPVHTATVANAPDCTAIGQTWTREKDSMLMMCVPAGSFTSGSFRAATPAVKKRSTAAAWPWPGIGSTAAR